MHKSSLKDSKIINDNNEDLWFYFDFTLTSYCSSAPSLVLFRNKCPNFFCFIQFICTYYIIDYTNILFFTIFNYIVNKINRKFSTELYPLHHVSETLGVLDKTDLNIMCSFKMSFIKISFSFLNFFVVKCFLTHLFKIPIWFINFFKVFW